MSEIDIYTQAIVSLLVITSPFDPIKIIFFENYIKVSDENRFVAATKVTAYCAILLVGAALIGKPLMQLMGINLDAFRVVGGAVIALMGFEMLYGGGASRAQGEDQRARAPRRDDQLLIPLSIPLIAGPGAITTAITLSASPAGILPLIAAISVTAIITLASLSLIGKSLERARPSTISTVARLGGLVLATIGMQMLLGGLKAFFA